MENPYAKVCISLSEDEKGVILPGSGIRDKTTITAKIKQPIEYQIFLYFNVLCVDIFFELSIIIFNFKVNVVRFGNFLRVHNCYFFFDFCIFAQVSLRVTVLLKTGCSGV